jgi:hypothetical protein
MSSYFNFNLNRYAFTPLLDASDDEEEEREPQTPHEAFGIV